MFWSAIFYSPPSGWKISEHGAGYIVMNIASMNYVNAKCFFSGRNTFLRTNYFSISSASWLFFSSGNKDSRLYVYLNRHDYSKLQNSRMVRNWYDNKIRSLKRTLADSDQFSQWVCCAGKNPLFSEYQLLFLHGVVPPPVFLRCLLSIMIGWT